MTSFEVTNTRQLIHYLLQHKLYLLLCCWASVEHKIVYMLYIKMKLYKWEVLRSEMTENV